MFNEVYGATPVYAATGSPRNWGQKPEPNRVPASPPPPPMKIHPFAFASQYIRPWVVYEGYAGEELLHLCQIVASCGPEWGNTKKTREWAGRILRVPPDDLKEAYEVALRVFREWSKGREFPGYIVTYSKKSYD